MYTLSKETIRVRKGKRGKRKRNMKVHSRNCVEESSLEPTDRNNNNSNESFLSKFSETMNDDLIGLSMQSLTYPKNLIMSHFNKYKFRERNFFKL